MFFIAQLEGMSLTKYIDSAHVQTISAGVTKTDVPDLKSWSWNKQLTLDEAISYYTTSLKKYEDAVNKAVTVPLTTYQFEALVSITYNIGISGMTHSAFVKDINSRCPAEKIKKDMLKWVKVKGKNVKGLLNRRMKEVALYFNGDYGDREINIFPVDSTTHKPLYNKGHNIVLAGE